jgi:opacity protein-like surface antigen
VHFLTHGALMKNFKNLSALTIAALATLLAMGMPDVYAENTSVDDTQVIEAQVDDAQADGWTGNVSGYLGRKFADADDWPNLDSQRSAGVIFDFRKQSWPVSIAADFISAAAIHKSGASEFTAGTVEMHLGARKIFVLENTSLRPYVGGGIAIVSATLENEHAGVTVDDKETAVGAWIGGGAYYAVTPHFNLGLDVRYSKAEVTLFDKDRQAGGLNVGITAGYHW